MMTMKKLIATLIIGSVIAPTLYAQSNQEVAALAGQSGCLVCHKADGKLVGPGFNEIAEKYKDQPNALQTLTQKVKKGGAGSWGRIPMPAHPQLSDETISTIVGWILKGAPN
jgi:cytochrome c